MSANFVMNALTRYKIGDFDGDGRDDIVSFEENRNFYVWLAQPNGTFLFTGPWGSNGGDINTARYFIDDFDGDGDTDVLSIEEGGGLYVWLADAFSRRFVFTGQWATDGAFISTAQLDRYRIADFNGDDRADVIKFAADAGFYVWLATSARSFSFDGQWGANGADLPNKRYKVGNVNNDNLADVISVENNGGIYVWIARPAGRFDPRVRWLTWK